MVLYFLSGDSLQILTGSISLFILDRRLDFLMLYFMLLILRKKLHFLGFTLYIIYGRELDILMFRLQATAR